MWNTNILRDVRLIFAHDSTPEIHEDVMKFRMRTFESTTTKPSSHSMLKSIFSYSEFFLLNGITAHNSGRPSQDIVSIIEHKKDNIKKKHAQIET